MGELGLALPRLFVLPHCSPFSYPSTTKKDGVDSHQPHRLTNESYLIFELTSRLVLLSL